MKMEIQHTRASVNQCIEQVLAMNERIRNRSDAMKAQLEDARAKVNHVHKMKLRQENAELKKLIENAKAELIRLETLNGKKQIPLPLGIRHLHTNSPSSVEDTAAQKADTDKPTPTRTPKTEKSAETSEKKKKTPKVPKESKQSASAEATTTTTVDLPVDVRRLDMRVGRILSVTRHPDADTLYVEKIDCGEEQPRTVVSGLVKHVPLEQMQDRMVVILCNLKPAKMRGVVSEAMVMCASTAERVEVLSPPAGAQPGDLVHCEGFPRQPDAQLNPKKKIFETCAPDLKTDEQLVACYQGAALHVPGKGNIVAQSLKGAPVK